MLLVFLAERVQYLSWSRFAPIQQSECHSRCPGRPDSTLQYKTRHLQMSCGPDHLVVPTCTTHPTTKKTRMPCCPWVAPKHIWLCLVLPKNIWLSLAVWRYIWLSLTKVQLVVPREKLVAHGCAKVQFVVPGCTKEQLVAHGHTKVQLVATGYAKVHLVAHGCTKVQLVAHGCSSVHLAVPGWTKVQLVVPGCAKVHLVAPGYTKIYLAVPWLYVQRCIWLSHGCTKAHLGVPGSTKEHLVVPGCTKVQLAYCSHSNHADTHRFWTSRTRFPETASLIPETWSFLGCQCQTNASGNKTTNVWTSDVHHVFTCLGLVGEGCIQHLRNSLEVVCTAMSENREMKKMKLSFFHQRHTLSRSFDIFVLTFL